MKIFKIVSVLLVVFSTYAQSNIEKYVIDDVGIYVEKSDSTKHFNEVFNKNNSIYTIEKEFTYSYFYQNKKGVNFLIKKRQEILQLDGHKTYDWDFINIEKQDSLTISKILLKIKSGNPFEKHISDYNQTAISYEYIMNNGICFTKEITGAIENEMNVWMHPPRSNFFEILELNPFPYIKAPYKIGTKWNWKLQIGEHWSDKRWLEWKGKIENNYEYEIKEKKIITTKLGDLECYVVLANATSRIGETKLISYFNSKIGFVKLEYKNIDGSKIILELVNVE